MNKGFTLVELLAVIVILAIIALIATPIVINVINEAQEGANARSVEGYMKAYESAYYQAKLKDPNVDFKSVTAEYSGADVKCNGSEAISADGKEITATCEIGGDTFIYSSKSGAKKN